MFRRCGALHIRVQNSGGSGEHTDAQGDSTERSISKDRTLQGRA